MIPIGWSIQKLETLFDIKHGFPFEGELFTPNETEFVLLTPGNFHVDQKLYFGSNTKYYTGIPREDYILMNGDLLVVMTDLTKEMKILGNAVILESNKKALHNQRIGKITDLKSDRVDTRYLMSLLNSSIVRNDIKLTASGSTVRHTSPSRILEIEVLLPPLPEQKKIAEILSCWDRGIEEVEKLIELERKIFSCYLEHFLSQKNASKPLGAFFRVVNGNAFKSTDYIPNGAPLIRISNIRDGLVTENGIRLPVDYLRRFEAFIVTNGDVLIAMSGATTGKFGIYKSSKKALLNQRVGRFDLIDSCVADRRIIKFILAFLQPKILSIAAGGAQPNISSSTIESLPVSLPTMELQINLCNLFENIDEAIHLKSQLLGTLKAQKTALMQQLLTGKIRVKGVA